jgi:hypothetical protein
MVYQTLGRNRNTEKARQYGWYFHYFSLHFAGLLLYAAIVSPAILCTFLQATTARIVVMCLCSAALILGSVYAQRSSTTTVIIGLA